MDADEWAHWKAYEIANGALDDSYSQEVQAQTLEAIHALRMVTAQRKLDPLDWPKVRRPWRVEEDVDPDRDEKIKQANIDALDKALGALEGK